MPLKSKHESDGRIATLLTNIADGFGRLVTEHLALAKLELTDDAAAVGKAMARILVFLPAVIIGYACLCAALVVLLTEWMPLASSLAAVGGGNLLVGMAGGYSAWRQIAARRVMGKTLEELNRSAAVLAHTRPMDGSEAIDARRS